MSRAAPKLAGESASLRGLASDAPGRRPGARIDGMFQRLNHRPGHYALLLAVGAALFLPNLGAPSLWDIDEGNNAEAAREMLESGNWIVPTFNFELRVDKPALLYWLQIAAYRAFGVNEFAARLPSALAALLAVLAAYELGRRMFGAAAGLVAGLVLASTALFGAAGHFANPDALLTLLTLLTFLAFWDGLSRSGRVPFVWTGLTMGLAFLAKGPVGLVLPFAVNVLYLFWSGRLRLLFTWRLVLGALAFGLVMVPWYAWVGADTKGDFLRGFFLHHNLDRALSPFEGHRGGVFYYALVLALGFCPWSAFLGLAAWYAFPSRRSEPQPERTEALRYLWCWVSVYLVAFTIARTKLPNYILPIYPAVALLTAHFLDGWRRGTFQPRPWLPHVSLVCLMFLGVGIGLGMAAAGGALHAPFLRGRQYAGLGPWAVLGAVPILGAVSGWRYLRHNQRTGVVASVGVSAVVFLAVLAAWGPPLLDPYKAPRALVGDCQDNLTAHEVRVATFDYFQPSLVFYCRREVKPLGSEEEAAQFLAHPLPVYLFVPASRWEAIASQVHVPYRLLGRRRDLYQNRDVVVVTNR